MTEWKRKRFWETVTTASNSDGVEVHLDGRALHTPGKQRLVLPTAALAQAIAAEWRAQGDEIDPRTMPLTRTANSAVETVAVHHATVADTVAAYGASDLICYRAEAPEELVRRQAMAWDPLVVWAEAELGARLVPGVGVVPIDQPPETLRRLRDAVHDFSPWQLAAVHDLVTLSGSLIIGLAVAREHAPLDDLWRLSRIDEDWQAEQWGTDQEAAEMAAYKGRGFADAGRFFVLSTTA